jgi:DtxR family transcriptional regulator, Mn-dependent transcriptional regulator
MPSWRVSLLLVPRATVRTEVGADIYGLNVKTLCQSRNDCSRITASDAQPLAACITQLTIEYVQRRGQPRPASPASRGEKCGVEHEERQHRLSVIDRRTPTRDCHPVENRAVPTRSKGARPNSSSNLAPGVMGLSHVPARCGSEDNRRDVSDLIDTTEMYLRTIYELEEEGIVPLRARIAERLHQSGPTVSQTVARMERDNLVHVLGDRHLELTTEGRVRATRVMRKHRLAERLLIDVIGLDWEKVHDEACRWEHVISEDVERKLVDLLNAPTMSPYGNPIPGLEELGVSAATEPFRDGNEQLQDVVSSSTSPITVVIERMSEEIQKDVEMMSTLRQAGIQPGAEVRAEVGGLGIRLTVDGLPSCEIDREASTHLFVSRV